MNEDYNYVMELLPQKDTLKASQSLVKMLAALEYSILESVSPTAAHKIFRVFKSIIHSMNVNKFIDTHNEQT